MTNLIQAAVVTLFAASSAQAQQAVQWKVSEGGNGHWYFCTPCTTGLDAESKAGALRAHLVTVTTAGENAYVRQLLAASGRSFAMLGLVQLDSQPAPQLGWTWATGEPVVFANWTDFDGAYGFSAPDDRPCAGGTPQEDNQCNQGLMYLDGRWDDVERGPSCAGFASSSVAVLEWSADCNGDGIVDYGQCRDGTLPDYNGNNIPDCCEAGTPCVVWNYPVQWRTAEGGNGRWYQVSLTSSPIRWADARDAARSQGGQLISVNSAEEQSFIEPLLVAAVDPEGCNPALFMGLTKVQGQSWRWEDGATLAFTNWACGEPADPDNPAGTMVMFNPAACEPYCVPHLRWNDIQLDSLHPLHRGLVIEWSADCNNDGIVDKGQILRDQLQDANGDGVPDICQQPICRDADFFPDRNINGVDLGVLLSQWGAPTQYTVADLNRDGVVDGIDLGLFLSFWGPCPY